MTRHRADQLCRRQALAGAFALIAIPSRADEAAKPDARASTASTTGVTFVPPKSGRPADRVGAGTRALPAEGSMLTLAVPEGGGLTTLAKPPLIWWLDAAVSGRMTVLIEAIAPETGNAGLQMEGKLHKGWYALDLERSDFALASGRIYRWDVALEPDPGAGTAERQTTYVERTGKPSGLGGDVRELAAAGLWFDALAPFVSVDLSGRVRVREKDGLGQLLRSAGVRLPD